MERAKLPAKVPAEQACDHHPLQPYCFRAVFVWLLPLYYLCVAILFRCRGVSGRPSCVVGPLPELHFICLRVALLPTHLSVYAVGGERALILHFNVQAPLLIRDVRSRSDLNNSVFGFMWGEKNLFSVSPRTSQGDVILMFEPDNRVWLASSEST
eukprot:3234012-Rhodomonas_salina.1